MAADGNGTKDTTNTTDATAVELLQLAQPMATSDSDEVVTDVLDEIADSLEVLRLVVQHAAQDLVDDKEARSAFDSTMYRVRARALTASKIAWRHSREACEAKDPRIDPYPGRVSTSLIFAGVVPECVLVAFRGLRIEGGEKLSSEEWLAIGQAMVDTYAKLRASASAATKAAGDATNG